MRESRSGVRSIRRRLQAIRIFFQFELRVRPLNAETFWPGNRLSLGAQHLRWDGTRCAWSALDAGPTHSVGNDRSETGGRGCCPLKCVRSGEARGSSGPDSLDNLIGYRSSRRCQETSLRRLWYRVMAPDGRLTVTASGCASSSSRVVRGREQRGKHWDYWNHEVHKVHRVRRGSQGSVKLLSFPGARKLHADYVR